MIQSFTRILISIRTLSGFWILKWVWRDKPRCNAYVDASEGAGPGDLEGRASKIPINLARVVQGFS